MFENHLPCFDIDRLRKEEAAIDDWEFKQTSKALKEIKKLEV